ncbi:MAG: pyridoxal phosphate-dependent aminotransferase [Victivallaceae bacterium]|nr:pyridoxal phosphate-dependent aminotransferase [Victivallaceae bacterium]
MDDGLNPAISACLGKGSMIRRMFEAGIELKKRYGADQVYDFSLGNPDLPPPPEVGEALKECARRAALPFSIGYMPNAGYPELRARLAEKVAAEQQCPVPAENLIVTCGAAGGINVFFHAVLSPGDEVIVPAPYFVEYGFYAANFGGKLVPAPSRDFTFELDFDALEAAFSARTRAVIINSPNNPTGRIYTREECCRLAALIDKMQRRFGRTIYLVSDEPYRFLNFDGAEIPSVFEIFGNSCVIGSFSKTLSLAGERIGYIAVSPKIAGAGKLTAALTFCNRIQGFVNAPALGQQILLRCLDAQADLEIYRRRRAAMAKVLSDASIEFTLPGGAFYFFARSPVPDEKVFVDALLAERILVVPGSGFGRPGYVRIAFCVDEKVISGAAEGFAAAAAKVTGKA